MQDIAVRAVENLPFTTLNYEVSKIGQPVLFTSVDVGICKQHSPNKRSTTLKGIVLK